MRGGPSARTAPQRIMRIRKESHIVFLVLFLFSVCLTGLSEAGPPKQILLINSYHEGYKGTDDIVAGFRSIVNRSLPDVYIKTEYLDSKNFSGDDYDRKLIDMLRYKYQRGGFDLVVASDDYAFNLVEKHYDGLFSPTPFVFCGTNAFDSRRIASKKGFYGVDELPSFQETIELILRLLPGTRRIVVIHDESLVGRINGAYFRSVAEAFSQELQFEYLSGLALEDLIDRITKLPPNAAGFYFASFVMDRTGKTYASSDALSMLSARSPVPIFGGWEFNLGHGIVGGKVVNLFEHGTFAGRLAVRILKGGEPPESLPKLSPSPNVYMFDDAQLKRFSLQNEQLPAGSLIINRRPTFYQQNRAEIFIALSSALALLIAFVVVFLYKSRRKLQRSYRAQMEIDASLRESQSSLRQALNEIKALRGILPICSSCKKIRDDKGYWQQIEQYISEHSEAQFSHGVCPECAKKLYPRFADRMEPGPGEE